MKSKRVELLSFCVTFLLACSAFAQSWTPPPLPDITPVISGKYNNDIDGDQIDDMLQYLVEDTSTAYLMAPLQAERRRAQMVLGEMVNVKLLFSEPVTQQQIDDFLFHCVPPLRSQR